MKRELKQFLLLLTGCFIFCCLCSCGSLEKKFTVLEAEASASEEKSAPAELGRYWYGYWYITDTQEDWRPLEGYSWDCCGELSSGENGFSLLLWDEDMPKDYYLARVDFTLYESSYSCTGGEFLDIDLRQGDVSIEALDDQGLLLELSGAYNDNSTGSFYYEIHLRPWGDEWPQGSGRPYHYERWYLPLIEAGEEPPDVIDPYG